LKRFTYSGYRVSKVMRGMALNNFTLSPTQLEETMMKRFTLICCVLIAAGLKRLTMQAQTNPRGMNHIA
jgi:hypothetical protein